jgi:hypothetical protein
VNRTDRDPRSVYTRLFSDFKPQPAAGGGAPVVDPRLELRRSLIDSVLQDATALRTRLGAGDRTRLDQHFDSMREVERRLAKLAEGASAPAPAQCQLPTGTDKVTNDMVTTKGIQQSLTFFNKLQSDILAMALACDRVRVFTYMLSQPGGHDGFPEIGIRGTFHELFHNQPQSDAINNGITYEMARMADSLLSLRAVKEGAGNLLDNCSIFSMTCVAEGHTHSLKDFPMLVIGRAGGALRYPGVFRHASNPDESAARTLLTAARAAGAKLPSWGTGPRMVSESIPELLA